MLKKVIVTGCAGFIGSHMVDLLLQENYYVVGVDVLSYAGSISNLNHARKNKNFFFYHENICNTDAIRSICQKHEIECIINFAAETHVDNSILGCDQFIESNIKGVVSILEVCKDLDIDILHISTDEVYGPASSKFFEDHALNPKNPYSASKAAAEHFVCAFSNTYNVSYKMIRAGNNFGPRQHSEKFTPKIIECLQKKIPVPVYGDGMQKREWIYVLDTASAILKVLQSGKDNEVYNISSGFEQDNITTVKKIAKEMGFEFNNSLLAFVEDRPGHDKRYLINTEKIENLGWKPNFVYEDSIKETVKFYLKNKKSV